MCAALDCNDMLFVGDSTIHYMFTAAEHLFSDISKSFHGCPTPNGCGKDAPRHFAPLPANHVDDTGCHKPRSTNFIPVLHYQVCRKHCPHRKVRLTFIRHDHAINHHGKSWGHDLQCDFWIDLFGKGYKWIYVSTGPHTPELIHFPFGVANSKNDTHSFKSTFTKQANDLAELVLRQIEAENANKTSTTDVRPVLIYQTGHWGIRDFNHDCKGHPLHASKPPEAFHGYEWDKIPLLQAEIMNVLQKRVPRDRLILLNIQEMLGQRFNCRSDHIHFVNAKFDTSPTWRYWQLIQNVLTAKKLHDTC